MTERPTDTIHDFHDVLRRLSDIMDAAKLDDAKAHILEDSLFEDVLRGIANGSIADPKMTAKVALESLNIKFDRWYE